jgi:hypothetical protein
MPQKAVTSKAKMRKVTHDGWMSLFIALDKEQVTKQYNIIPFPPSKITIA